MSTRFTLSDADYNKPSIATDGGDLTLVLAPAAGAFVVEIGDNLWVGTQFRHQINRALEQIRDKLREAQWPDGALATNFATIAGVDTPKGDIVVGNAASAPAITEDGIRVSYNIPASGAGADSGGTSASGGGGFGSSVNRDAIFEYFKDEILELLSTTAVAPP